MIVAKMPFSVFNPNPTIIMIIDTQFPENYFRNENHKALFKISLTYHLILKKARGFLEKHDITPQQYNILRILNFSEKPLSTLSIRELMIDKMSDTSRIVDRMVKKGLVYKRTGIADKRLVDVSIAQKGKELFTKLEEEAKELDSILNNLTKEDITHLNHLLDKIRDQEQG